MPKKKLFRTQTSRIWAAFALLVLVVVGIAFLSAGWPGVGALALVAGLGAGIFFGVWGLVYWVSRGER